MKTILLSGMVRDSITDGPGIRMTIFTQGCPHHCRGCHNPETWSFQGGTPYTAEELLAKVDANPLERGVTFSGGEPLEQVEALLPFARGLKERGKDMICYTGYTFEQLLERMEKEPLLEEFLGHMDIIIDGPFEIDQRDLTLPYRGSANQRVLDAKLSLSRKKPVVWEE